MIIKNTETQFGLINILLHWVMALIIIGMICVGLYMKPLPLSPLKLQLFRWHKEYGILILMLVFVRFGWRVTNITPTLGALPLWESIAARSVHWLFYGFMFVMPITGWMLSSAAGVSVSFFGLFVLPDLIAPNESLRELFTTLHDWLAFALIGVLCLHVGAALKHYVIDKDEILQRMIWP